MNQPAAALRDRIADAVIPLLLDTLPKVIARSRGYEVADAVLAVLLEPADRAAVLNEAIARVRRIPVQCTGLTGPVWFGQGWKDAIGEFEEIAERLADEDQRRLAAGAQPTTQADTETLAAMFEGLGRLLATSSRDWGQYAPDAWLYAVVLGWDCEETEHDETCTHGAMEEMQQRHGWSDEAVAKARRYRAAVRALTEPAAGMRQDGAQSP